MLSKSPCLIPSHKDNGYFILLNSTILTFFQSMLWNIEIACYLMQIEGTSEGSFTVVTSEGIITARQQWL